MGSRVTASPTPKCLPSQGHLLKHSRFTETPQIRDLVVPFFNNVSQ